MKYIGFSDIASLVLRGSRGVDGFPTVQELFFGGDGDYYAHVVKDGEKVPSHYELCYSCKGWLKIYGDRECEAEFRGGRINVYRAGQYGCTIEVLTEEE